MQGAKLLGGIQQGSFLNWVPLGLVKPKTPQLRPSTGPAACAGWTGSPSGVPGASRFRVYG